MGKGLLRLVEMREDWEPVGSVQGSGFRAGTCLGGSYSSPAYVFRIVF